MGFTSVVAAKAIIMREGKALIIRRADNDQIGPGSWEFAGGKLEFGEQPEDCLRREVLEETGLTIDVGAVAYAAAFTIGDTRQTTIIAYYCTAGQGQVCLSAEHQDFCWADRPRLEALLPANILNDISKNGAWARMGME